MLVKEDSQVLSDAKSSNLRQLIEEFLDSREIQEAKIDGYFSIKPPTPNRGRRSS